MIDSINAVRSARGLSPVHRNTQLEAAALEHAKDMAANSWIIESKNYHTGSNGSTIEERVRSTGYNPIRWSEITGYGFGGDAGQMMDWWMASPVHRDVILSAEVTEAGSAYLYAPGSVWGAYWCVVFGRPVAAPVARPYSVNVPVVVKPDATPSNSTGIDLLDAERRAAAAEAQREILAGRPPSFWQRLFGGGQKSE